MPTNFPQQGDDLKVSLRNSQYPQFDRDWAERLKANHPDIWKAGGNIRGNDAFSLWGKARDGAETEAVLDWIREREAWSARHLKDFRLPGVVAQIKWGVIGSRGQAYMKNLINEKIKDKENKMADQAVADYIQQIDQHVIKCLSEGSLPAIPEITDLATFMAGFVSRNLSKRIIELPEIQTDKQTKSDFRPLSLGRVSAEPTLTTETKAVADFQGFVIGIVLEPGCPEKPDLHGQWMSAEDIERSCDNWSLYHQRVGIQHQEWAEQQGINHPDFVCVRNWIEYGCPIIGGYKVKPGTWLQAYQAVSERGIAMLKNYEINGLSPGGIGTVWASPKQEESDDE